MQLLNKSLDVCSHNIQTQTYRYTLTHRDTYTDTHKHTWSYHVYLLMAAGVSEELASQLPQHDHYIQYEYTAHQLERSSLESLRTNSNNITL